MRILTVSINAWDDTNSFGNTVSNFFGDFRDAEFMSLYFRSSNPNNAVCKKYYKISEKAMIKGIFAKGVSGRYFELKGNEKKAKAKNSSKKLISFIHRHKIPFIYSGFDMITSLKTWQDDNLLKAIKDFDPQIIFAFAKADAQYYHSLEYLRENTGAKIVLFCADDVYTMYRDKKDIYSRILTKRFKKLMTDAHKIYGISKEMCNYYGTEFCREMSILRKGCKSFAPVNAGNGEKIRIVYAGNLYYGRFEILCKIADAVKKCTEKNIPVEFEIYSGDTITSVDRQKLENPAVRFMGSRPYSEIVRILSESDIVLHTESFRSEQIKKVKYSFSTKIIDCLESGSVLWVVGPLEAASVSYAKEIAGAMVTAFPEDIEKDLTGLASDKATLYQRALLMQDFARENHHISHVRKNLYEDFAKLLEN